MARSRAMDETSPGVAAAPDEESLETPATTAAPSPFGWSREREFQGPVRFQTIGPFPDAEGEPIPDGKEFVAGPKIARGLWHSGMVKLVQEYGPSEGAPATDDPEDVEMQLRLLELMSQRMARRKEDGELYQDRYLKSIERLLATLESFIGDLLTKYTHGTVPPDDPDLRKRLHEWEVQLLEGEVPKEFDRQAVQKDRDKAEGLLYYSGLLSSLRSQIRDGFRWAFPAAQVLAERQEGELRTLMLEAEGRTAEAREHQQKLDEDALEAADAYDLAASDLLEALRIALSLLASMNPEDLIRGARQLGHTRKAGGAKKYAPGIQAAVNHVYRDGMTEQECWASLEAVGDLRLKIEGREYTVQVDAGEEEEPTVYEFTQNRRTKQERSVKRGSFYPYFKRAQEPASIR